MSSADPSITNQPDATIPVIYVNLGNDSFKVVPKNLTWEDARKNCELEKTNLVSIRNEWSLAYVELMAKNLKAPVWIGLNKQKVPTLRQNLSNNTMYYIKKSSSLLFKRIILNIFII